MAPGIKTGGRQKGSHNKKTAELQAKIEASGLTPLDYMLRVLREESSDPKERMSAAIAAAPYVHAKLTSVDVQGPGKGGAHKVIVSWEM